MKKRVLRVLISSLFILTVSACALLSYYKSHADSPNGPTVVAVHGINAGPGLWGTARNGDNTMPYCNTYWEDAKAFLQPRWSSDFRQVGYYSNDCPNNGVNTQMSADLHNRQYATHCASYWTGSEGTNNENINHLACLLGWYLYDNFGQYQGDEILLGHSMGGLVIRKTLELVQQHDPHLPTTIGHVIQVFAFNTPQAGHIMAGLMCGFCTEGLQMDSLSGFIRDLNAHGQDIQVGGSTEWILFGGGCDSAVGVDAMRMHASEYYWYNSVPCYNHGDSIHDRRLAHSSTLVACTTTHPLANDCNVDFFGKLSGPGWHTQTAAPHSLELAYEIMQGLV